MYSEEFVENYRAVNGIELLARSLGTNIDQSWTIRLDRELLDDNIRLLIVGLTYTTVVYTLEYQFTAIHPTLERENLVIGNLIRCLTLAVLDVLIRGRLGLLVALEVVVAIAAIDTQGAKLARDGVANDARGKGNSLR